MRTSSPVALGLVAALGLACGIEEIDPTPSARGKAESPTTRQLMDRWPEFAEECSSNQACIVIFEQSSFEGDREDRTSGIEHDVGDIPNRFASVPNARGRREPFDTMRSFIVFAGRWTLYSKPNYEGYACTVGRGAYEWILDADKAQPPEACTIHTSIGSVRLLQPESE